MIAAASPMGSPRIAEYMPPLIPAAAPGRGRAGFDRGRAGLVERGVREQVAVKVHGLHDRHEVLLAQVELSAVDGVEDQVWSDFLNLRKRKKAIVTDRVIQSLKKEGEKARKLAAQAASGGARRGSTPRSGGPSCRQRRKRRSVGTWI